MCSRELFAKAGAAAAAFAAVQGASAKAGQFSKLSVFDLVGQPAISSPFQAGGPKAGPDATFGYAKSDGPILSTGYAEDVTRELKDYKVSSAIVKAQVRHIHLGRVGRAVHQARARVSSLMARAASLRASRWLQPDLPF